MKSVEYLDRDISWLSFNTRVMEEADKDIPLAERVMFHGITFSNLSEFLMTRYAASINAITDGITIDDVMQKTDEGITDLQKCVTEHYQMLSNRFSRFNDTNRIIRKVNELLDAPDRKWLDKYFKQNIFPALQPATFDKLRPLEPRKGLNIFVECYDGKSEVSTLNYIEIPSGLERFVKVPDDNSYVLIEDIIMHNLDYIFKDRKIVRSCAFSVLRSAEIYISMNSNLDQYKMIEKTLHERERAWITCLEIGSSDKAAIKTLKNVISITANTLVFTANYVNLADLKAIDNKVFTDDQMPRKLKPTNPFPAGNIFEYIRKGDRLVFHPYESYQDSFVRFLEEASEDSDVISIKISLYRVADNSSIIKALLKAADKGKLVTVLVELKARFDEHHNIQVASVLKEGGVRIVYGSPDLKTHAKLCLVTRNEKKGLRIYSHIGTGNYNESNAKSYTDYSYFTADHDIGTDLTRFFNLLTSDQGKFKSHKILYAPYNLRSEITENIDKEIKLAKDGKDGRIIFKCNALTDDKIVDKLIKAAQAGVKIVLIVRGACIIRPMKNIKIYSIVGRFLEHSRVYMFGKGKNSRVYIGSNDMMYRNLNLRNELMLLIEDEDIKSRIKDHLVQYVMDNVNRRKILDDYKFKNMYPDVGEKVSNCQENFIKEAKKRAM